MCPNECKIYLQKNMNKFDDIKNLTSKYKFLTFVEISLKKKSLVIHCVCENTCNFDIHYTYKELLKSFKKNDSLSFDLLLSKLKSSIESSYKNSITKYNNLQLELAKKSIRENLKKDFMKKICEYECTEGKIQLNEKNNLVWNNIVLNPIPMYEHILNEFKPTSVYDDDGIAFFNYDNVYDEILEEFVKQYISKIKNKLFRVKSLAESIQSEVFEKYNKIINLFNEHAYPMLNGINKQQYQIECFCVFDKTNYYIFRTTLGDIEYDNGNIIEKFNDKTNNLLELLNNKKYLSAETYVLEKINNCKDLIFNIKKPLLLRDSIVVVNDRNNFKKSYNYQFIDYKKSIIEFRNEFNKYFNTILKDFAQFKKDEEERIKKEYNLFLENFIYEDIIKFIKKNETYITANATIQALRGLKIQLNSEVKRTTNCGKYKYYSNEDVMNCIQNLIYEDFLLEKEIKGAYGYFYILKIGKNKIFSINENFKISILNKKFKENIVFSDREALFYFNEIKDKKNNDNYIKLLHLVYAKGFMSLYGDEYMEVMKNLPEEIKSFVKMKEKIEEDKMVKKIYKELCKKK